MDSNGLRFMSAVPRKSGGVNRMSHRTDSRPVMEKRTAEFSQCRSYRYRLDIIWDVALPLCQFVGLNPSTADEVQDDPTIRRCKDFSKRWGYGGLAMSNLFAFRATLPKDMKAAANPVGEPMPYGTNNNLLTNWNDYHLLNAQHQCKLTIAAWGKDGTFLNRHYQVAKLLSAMKCLGRGKNGQPLHPLYQPADAMLIDYGLT